VVDGVEGATNASDVSLAGAVRLSENLLYMNARTYSPKLRRFIQPDNVDFRRYTYAGEIRLTLQILRGIGRIISPATITGTVTMAQEEVPRVGGWEGGRELLTRQRTT
jgi:RHS repeat-associated protein